MAHRHPEAPNVILNLLQDPVNNPPAKPDNKTLDSGASPE